MSDLLLPISTHRFLKIDHKKLIKHSNSLSIASTHSYGKWPFNSLIYSIESLWWPVCCFFVVNWPSTRLAVYTNRVMIIELRLHKYSPSASLLAFFLSALVLATRRKLVGAAISSFGHLRPDECVVLICGHISELFFRHGPIALSPARIKTHLYAKNSISFVRMIGKPIEHNKRGNNTFSHWHIRVLILYVICMYFALLGFFFLWRSFLPVSFSQQKGVSSSEQFLQGKKALAPKSRPHYQFYNEYLYRFLSFCMASHDIWA